MAKKKIIETTGKEETNEPTTLDQIMGFNELARYSTLDIEVYDKTLDEMNRPDLEGEARRVGAIIVESTPRLRENLKKEFISYVSMLRKPKSLVNKPVVLTKELQKILNEGR